MKIKTLKSIILGIDIKPIGTILEVGPDISEADAQRLIGFGDMVELIAEVVQPLRKPEKPVEGPKTERRTIVKKPEAATPTPVPKTAIVAPKGKKTNKK